MDNIVITGSDQDGIQKLKQHLVNHFQAKDFGKLKYFLGIEVAQSSIIPEWLFLRESIPWIYWQTLVCWIVSL